MLGCRAALLGGVAGPCSIDSAACPARCERDLIKMKFKLIELNPLGHNRKVVLDKLPAVLGRSSSSQILVADQWVSRRHCELDEVDGVLVVRDLGSRHGTYVNGMRVSEARLLPDDKLTVGLTSFVASYRVGVRSARPADCLATDR